MFHQTESSYKHGASFFISRSKQKQMGWEFIFVVQERQRYCASKQPEWVSTRVNVLILQHLSHTFTFSKVIFAF